MMFCPKDFKTCIDDLCRGSGCILLGGEPMLEQCSNCGQLFGGDVECSCGPDYEEYEDWEED